MTSRTVDVEVRYEWSTRVRVHVDGPDDEDSEAIAHALFEAQEVFSEEFGSDNRPSVSEMDAYVIG